MMVRVYLKTIRKTWLGGITAPLLIVILIPMIMLIWPEMKAQAASFMELMKNPVYKVIAGDLVNTNLGTWQGFFFMEIFMCVDWVVLFLAIFSPARLITNEVDKKTLDVVLSFPISRWRFILEKFCVYLTFNALFPILIFTVTYIGTQYMGETLDYTILGYSLVGTWFLLFTLGALSLFCGAIFLEGNRTIAASGALILGQYILLRYAGIVESMYFLKNWSLFNYLNAASIMKTGQLPINDLLIMSLVGVVALFGALYTFQKRELAY